MQKWEYMSLDYIFQDDYELQMVTYTPGGRREREWKKHGAQEAFPDAIAQLGLQGWEMVSNSPCVFDGCGNTGAWRLWFKRPIED